MNVSAENGLWLNRVRSDWSVCDGQGLFRWAQLWE